MMQRVARVIKNHPLVILICLALILTPFFWIKPGEMDIGGDSSRLYYYDPFSFLKNFGLFGIVPDGTGSAEPNHYYLPFVILLLAIKQIVKTPYFLISIMNGLILALAFISIFKIVKEVLSFESRTTRSVDIAASIAGLFYVFSPMVINNWDKALISIHQVFLNPLMFYLLMRFILSGQWRYLWTALSISIVFAPNFSFATAPPFFAFYPLSLIFLLLYCSRVRKQLIPWKRLALAIGLFIGLHAFHLLPQFASLMDPGSFTHSRVFDKKTIFREGYVYFSAVLPYAKVSWFLLLPSYVSSLKWTSFSVPAIVILGGMLNSKRRLRVLSLTTIFFIMTLFLVAANITHAWVKLYKLFFFIPGFSMFRNFSGQWQFVFVFFYALVLGESLWLVLESITRMMKVVISVLFILILFWGASPFITGELVNKKHADTDADNRVVMRMDPDFETLLTTIKQLPGDGKIFTLPFSDGFYQVLHGTNNGAYVGPSIISYIGGRPDFAGYLTVAPFPEVFYQLVKEKNIDGVKRLFSMLNVKYIFWNADPRVYDNSFPRSPYSYVRNFLPKTQEEMGRFIKSLGYNSVYSRGWYRLYAVDVKDYIPHIYAGSKIHVYLPKRDDWYGQDASFFVSSLSEEKLSVFIEKSQCESLLNTMRSRSPGLTCDETIVFSRQAPKIQFFRINPIKYKLHISGTSEPYLLVFSQKYNNNWRLFFSPHPTPIPPVQSYEAGMVQVGNYYTNFFDRKAFETMGMTEIARNTHRVVNGYANGWLVTPMDTGGKMEYEIVIEMVGQRMFYLGLCISVVTFFIIILIAHYQPVRFHSRRDG